MPTSFLFTWPRDESSSRSPIRYKIKNMDILSILLTNFSKRCIFTRFNNNVSLLSTYSHSYQFSENINSCFRKRILTLSMFVFDHTLRKKIYVFVRCKEISLNSYDDLGNILGIFTEHPSWFWIRCCSPTLDTTRYSNAEFPLPFNTEMESRHIHAFQGTFLESKTEKTRIR